MTQPQTPVPIVWTIAGSDSGGGAGIQVDLKTMNAFGVHGCSVITALTAQNTLGVQSVEPVSEAMLRAQLQALEEDLFPSAIKTGMLGSSSSCKIVADFLERSRMRDAECGRGDLGSRISDLRFSATPLLICDPVLKSTSGADLLDPEALDILIRRIFPKVGILTPNLPEVEALVGQGFHTVEAAAEQVLKMGVASVLIKGGHAEDPECRDYWTDGTQSLWLSSPRIETAATHGTGCILSSAIASAIALGQEIPKAVTTAKTFLNQCLKSPANIGKGHGSMRVEPFRNAEEDRLTIVGGNVDSANAVVGGVDPVPQNPETDPGSPPPATTSHSRLRRLSKVFVDDPAYFVTTCTKKRRKVLDNPAVHQILRKEWEDALERHGWAIGSYVVMPDHVHFFCKPTHEACTLSELMQHWKEWTSKRIKREMELKDGVWQEEFFDHLLRSHESYSEKWNYVEQNPVRAGFVENAVDWSYSGFIHYK